MVAVARLAPKGFLEDRAKCAPPRSAHNGCWRACAILPRLILT